MSKLVSGLKRFVSYFTDKKISDGIGLSTDEGVKLKKPLTVKQTERPVSKFSAKYELRNDIGSFELVNMVTGKKAPRYQLRNILTGEQLTVDAKLFRFLFKKTQD